MALTTQTRKFNVVINFAYDLDEKDILNKLDAYLKTSCEEYSYIVHDKDELNDGILKTKHIHVVYIKTSRTRVISEINYLAKALGYDNSHRSLVSVEAMEYYERSLRYLIHKDDIEKYQYNRNEVVSSLPQDFLSQIFDAEAEEYITIDYLIKVIEENNGAIKFIYRSLGLKLSVRYRNILLDLVKQYQADVFNNKLKKCKDALDNQVKSLTNS